VGQEENRDRAEGRDKDRGEDRGEDIGVPSIYSNKMNK
jgi:hypothetical protein